MQILALLARQGKDGADRLMGTSRNPVNLRVSADYFKKTALSKDSSSFSTNTSIVHQ